MKKIKMKKTEKKIKEKRKEKGKKVIAILLSFLFIFSLIWNAHLISAATTKPKYVEEMEKFRETMEIIGKVLYFLNLAQQAFSYYKMFMGIYKFAKVLKTGWVFHRAYAAGRYWDAYYPLSQPSGIIELAAILITVAVSTIRAGMLVEDWGEAYKEPALTGTSYCGLCSWDEFTPCIIDRCAILGNCYYQPTEDERGGLCIPAECEKGYPKLKGMTAEFYVDKELIVKKSARGCPDGHGACSLEIAEVPWNATTLYLSFETDPRAECRYIIDKTQASFADMQIAPGEIEMPTSRTFSIDISELEKDSEHYVFVKCRGPCDESTHPEGFDWNYVKFKIGPYPDWVAPRIFVDPAVSRLLNSSVMVVGDTTEQLEIKLYLDKSASCGYSTEHPMLNLTTNYFLDKDCSKDVMCHFGSKLSDDDFVINSACEKDQSCLYYLMQGGPSLIGGDCTKCSINVSLKSKQAKEINWKAYDEQIKAVNEQAQQQGFECPSEIGGGEAGTETSSETGSEAGEAGKGGACIITLGEGELKKEIQLRDMLSQLAGFSTAGTFGESNKIFRLMFRCANQLGYLSEPQEYNILVMPGYELKIISPTNGYSSYRRELKLNVSTSRLASCSYSINAELPYEKMQRIASGFDVLHTTTLELEKGNYTVYVKCRDIFGIEQSASASFEITPYPMPQVIRMFVSDGKLFIETDIESECVYSINKELGCDFNATDSDQASPFSALTDLAFETYSNEADEYYIKCIDKWHDNDWPSECITIKPFELELQS
ncbi:MAG: hypothetical protein QXO56_00710 [Candidatus Pacearchaeota archaeon]